MGGRSVASWETGTGGGRQIGQLQESNGRMPRPARGQPPPKHCGTPSWLGLTQWHHVQPCQHVLKQRRQLLQPGVQGALAQAAQRLKQALAQVIRLHLCGSGSLGQSATGKVGCTARAASQVPKCQPAHPPHLQHIQTAREVSHKPLSWCCLCSRAAMPPLLPLQQPAAGVAACVSPGHKTNRLKMHRMQCNASTARPSPPTRPACYAHRLARCTSDPRHAASPLPKLQRLLQLQWPALRPYPSMAPWRAVRAFSAQTRVRKQASSKGRKGWRTL